MGNMVAPNPVAKLAEWKRKYSRLQIAQGLCRSGCGRHIEPGTTRCFKHNQMQRGYMGRLRESRIRSGRCSYCGKKEAGVKYRCRACKIDRRAPMECPRCNWIEVIRDDGFMICLACGWNTTDA